MQRNRSRHHLSVALAVIMALGLVAPVRALAQTPGPPFVEVEPEISPPEGKCAIRGNDTVTFSGSATPDATLTSAILRQRDASGEISADDLDVKDDVDLVDGAISGQRTVGFTPESTTATMELIVTVAKEGASAEGTSDPPVTVDLIPPAMTSARTISGEEVVVRFSEPVVNPESDSVLDWRVNGEIPPTDITGSGNERTLRVSPNNGWDEDATPVVVYRPPPLRAIYQDCTDNTVVTGGRARTAADRIAPVRPAIDLIDDKSASDDDVASNQPAPSIVVSGVTDGHDIEIYQESGGHPQTLDDDTLLATGTSEGGGATIPLPPFASDGAHRLYAIARDGASNQSPADAAKYRLDTLAPHLISATADASTVLVVFDDALVTGWNNKDAWTISQGNTEYPVTAVEGQGSQRILSADSVPDGATIEYNGDADYADEAGNELAPTSLPVTSNFLDPSTMTLDVQPETQERPSGGSHTFDLRLTDHFGAPVPGFRLGGKVLTGPGSTRDLDGNPFTGSGAIGICVTDGTGTCSLSYPTQGGGTDTVLGWIDTDNDGNPDEVPGTPEPSNASGINDVRTHDTVEATTTGGTSPGPTPGPSPAPTPTATPSAGATPSPSPSASPSASPTPEPSPTPGPTPEPEPLQGRSATLQADEGTVELGRRVRLSGLVVAPADCRSGAEVRVMRRIGTDVEQIRGPVSDTEGTWRARFRSTRNAAYYVEVFGGEACAPATSDEVVVKVRAAVDALVLNPRIGSGGCARVKGRVAPNKRGDAVWLQRRTARRWRSIDSDLLSSSSRFSFPACFDRAGRKTLRVRWAADGANAASRSSPMRVRVTR